MTSPNRRRETDLMKLMMGNFEVNTVSDGLEEFYVLLHGPAGSLYEGGVWKLKVELAEDYPFSPPWIVFTNKIYHPNVNEVGGAICLDVIKHCWSPMFDMVNVFDQFLPQLLLYPNPEDPLNKDAAALMMSDPALYEAKVREYCDKYAKPEDVGAAVPPKEPSDEEITEDEHDSSSSDDGPVDPLPGPSMTKTEHDSSDKPDAGPVDAPSKTEDECGSSNVDPQPDAGPVDAPSMTEDEHGSSEEPKPDALLSLTEALSLE